MIRKIIVWFIDNIILPIKRWWHLHINGYYLPDNMRTQAVFNFLDKVIQDPTYQPSGAYELSFEDELLNYYQMVYNDIRAGNNPHFTADAEIPPYSELRKTCAINIYNMLIEFPIINEDN